MTLPEFQFENKFSVSDVLTVVMILGYILAAAWHESARDTKQDIAQAQQSDAIVKIGAQAQADSDWIKLEIKEREAFPPFRIIGRKIFYADGRVEELPK
jgi:hypothetical protein